MVQGDRLSNIDDDDLPGPPQEVVFAQIRVHEFRLPDSAHVRHDIIEDGVWVLQGDLAEGRRRLGLVPDVLHHEHIVEHPFRVRHTHTGVPHPDEVLVFLLGPCQERGPRRALHFLEARIALDVHGDVPERRGRDPVDLHRLRAPIGARRVEDVRLLPRAHRVVEGREDPVRDQLGNRQEGGVVEDFVVGLASLRVFLLCSEGVDLGLQASHASLVNHGLRNERSAQLRALWAVRRY